MTSKRFLIVCVVLLLLQHPAHSQDSSPEQAPDKKGAAGRVVDAVFDYLSMAGTAAAADFRPLTQGERNAIYVRSMGNALLYVKAATSGAIDHRKNKPAEWGQGGAGYGKRTVNILGQYAIQRTVTFGVSSLLHEDTRYFGSGKKGFWSRTTYALSSSVLARGDDGRRRVSMSQIAGFAGGAFLSRLWQPPSTRSAADGAISFGISMGANTAISVLKEFLPDILRPLIKGRNTSN